MKMYVLFFLIAVLSVCVIMLYSSRRGVVCFGEKIKIYKPCGEKINPYKGILLYFLVILSIAFLTLIQISLYRNTSAVNFIKLYGVSLVVLSAGIIDSKLKIIPNTLIILGVFFRISIYIYEFVSKADIKTIFINDMIGFAIGFVFLAIVSFASKGALGFGDVKLFGIIGLTCGSFCTYSTLLISLIVSALFSVISICLKKMDKKDSFPFGPCIVVGYILAILLTSY